MLVSLPVKADSGTVLSTPPTWCSLQTMKTYCSWSFYRGADKSLARPTSLSILFSVQRTGGSPTGPDSENRMGDQDNESRGKPFSSGFTSARWAVSFLAGLRAYQHPCNNILVFRNDIALWKKLQQSTNPTGSVRTKISKPALNHCLQFKNKWYWSGSINFDNVTDCTLFRFVNNNCLSIEPLPQFTLCPTTWADGCCLQSALYQRHHHNKLLHTAKFQLHQQVSTTNVTPYELLHGFEPGCWKSYLGAWVCKHTCVTALDSVFCTHLYRARLNPCL
jgi:hypothetical protein